jgi:hypothetical protein
MMTTAREDVDATGDPDESGVTRSAGAAPDLTSPLPSTAARTAFDPQLEQLVSLAENRAERARTKLLEARAGVAEAGDARRLEREFIRRQVDLRMLYLMAGNQSRALEAIPNIDPAQQEFWQMTLWGMANYFDHDTMPEYPDRATQTVSQFRNAIRRLQGDARLELRNLSFCHKIASFGNFDRFERDEFTTGQRVLLYCEIVNFKSEPQPADGTYRTQLKSRIEIYRAGRDGALLEEIDFPETVDLCRSHRQDYFHSYELRIPEKLGLGPHVLKLTVTDSLSGKIATDRVNFVVE